VKINKMHRNEIVLFRSTVQTRFFIENILFDLDSQSSDSYNKINLKNNSCRTLLDFDQLTHSISPFSSNAMMQASLPIL